MASVSTQIFGIVNITADSFSDGGKYLDPQAAISHAQDLLSQGAHVLDVGPASSHPDAGDVSAATEIARLESVWAGLKALGAPISVDSFQPATQRWAMAQGADWLNDINGFAEASLYDELADYNGKLVVMHAIQAKGIATREAPPEGDIWPIIFRFFEQRLEAFERAGIARDKLVLDPGMGFFLGNRPETSLEVLAGLNRLKRAFDVPVLVCVSRKSFLRALASPDETPIGVEQSGSISLAGEMLALEQQVDFIRTHAPEPLAQAVRLRRALLEK
jgi:dihydropteroate synthase type 2